MRGTAGVMAAGLMGILLSTAQAGERVWLEPVNGDFADGGNWTGAVVPGSMDSAVHDHPVDDTWSPYIVSITEETSIAELIVRSAEVRLDLGAALNVAGPVTAGAEGIGLLGVAGQELRSIGGIIAAGADAVGAVTLLPQARWNAGTGQLLVGGRGAGSLSIGPGASIISGPGILAAEPGSMAAVTIEGGGWTSSDLLRIGAAGSASLQVYDGGTVSSVGGEVGGAYATGSVLVSGASSAWTNAGGLSIGAGDGSAGELVVELGGRVRSGSMTIGGSLSGEGSGAVHVTGGTVNVDGALLIRPSGELEMQSGTVSAGRLDLYGQVRMIGQSVLDLDDLGINSAGAIDIGGGRLIVRSNADEREAVYGELLQWIEAGRADGTWTGPGIRSSAAGLDADYGLTLMVNDASDVVVAFGLAGDLDISGAIDGDDYYLMDQGFTGARLLGDMNYDGRVDGIDYQLLDTAFLKRVNAPGSAFIPVPEPGMLLMLPMALLILRRRR